MELRKAKGLVVRAVDYGERDRILTVYTEEYGLITVTAHGSRSVKSRTMVATELFCYSDFLLTFRSDRYTVREVSLIENFFPLRVDIVKMSLACYFCEVLAHVGTENMPDAEMLRLGLNCLYALANDRAPHDVVKAAFEIRASALLGFMPDIRTCVRCGNEGEDVVLDVMDGSVKCAACRREMEEGRDSLLTDEAHASILCPLTPAARAALYYVLSCPPEKILSFRLENAADRECLARAAETYLLNQLETGFKKLDYYKEICHSVRDIPDGKTSDEPKDNDHAIHP